MGLATPFTVWTLYTFSDPCFFSLHPNDHSRYNTLSGVNDNKMRYVLRPCTETTYRVVVNVNSTWGDSERGDPWDVTNDNVWGRRTGCLLGSSKTISPFVIDRVGVV